jgi:hypothetical protein
MKIIKIIIFVTLFLILTSFVFAESELKDFNYFSSDDLERIITSVEIYESVVNQYSSKFEVPSYILKSLIGIETEGIINRQEIFNDYNEIGLTHLKPFDENGNSIHYDLCIESDCMAEIENLNSDFETKKNQVESEYLNVHNSICCAAYILQQEYDKGDIGFPINQNDCSDIGIRAYAGWDSALRRFKGLECDSGLKRENDYINYVEKAGQLINVFQNSADYSTSSFGLLRFTPSFSIAAPTLIDTFNKLPLLIEDLQSANSEIEVNQKLSSFASDNNVTFGYCEAPEVNAFNSFYDRIVGAFDSEETSCKYRITEPNIKVSGRDITLVSRLTFQLKLNATNNILTIENNLPEESNLFRSLDVIAPNNLILDVNEIKIIDDNPIIGLNSMYAINNFADKEFENVYLYKQNNKTIFLFSMYGDNSELEYYNSNLELVENVPVNCIKKYKYFTCLDTKQKEEVYNWALSEWVESTKTVKIKFAFAIPKSVP